MVYGNKRGDRIGGRVAGWVMGGLAAGLLAGCATTPPMAPYKAPAQGEPRARLVMRGNMPAGSRYYVTVAKDAYACKGSELAGASKLGGGDPESTWLPAKGLSTVQVLVSLPEQRVCSLVWSFYPKNGRNYLLQSAAVPGGCTVMLLDATNPDAVVPEPTALRRNQGGQACMPVSQIQKNAASQDSRGGLSGAGAGPKPGQAELHDGVTDDQLKGLLGGQP